VQLAALVVVSVFAAALALGWILRRVVVKYDSDAER